MPISYAILLDGGFLRHKLHMRQSPTEAASIVAFTHDLAELPCLSGMRLHRIYFYDAAPLSSISRNPLSEAHVNFGTSAAASRNRKLQVALSREPFFALRFGELIDEGWRLKRRVLERASRTITIDSTDIEPDVRQKGVDMRIGLDIASLTLKGQVQVIVLVTGDSDFIPAMKFARREGAQLFLVTLGHGIREELRAHADLVIEETLARAIPAPCGRRATPGYADR